MIIQNSALTEEQSTQLSQLFNDCMTHDSTTPKFYWEIIKHKRADPGNFLYYENKLLIGYLGFFFFGGDSELNPEIVAIVHPDYRRQSVFKKLFNAACAELSKHKVNRVIFPFSNKNEIAKNYLKQQMGKYLYTEYYMQRLQTSPEIIENTPISIQEATEHDISTIAFMDCACFHVDYQTMLNRFQETIFDHNRCIYLAYLNHECIGKAHVHYTEDGIGIHNICIMPSMQNKGYGTILVKLVINEMLTRYSALSAPKMYLEVIATNEFALNVYKKCNFVVRDAYEYWSVSIEI